MAFDVIQEMKTRCDWKQHCQPLLLRQGTCYVTLANNKAPYKQMVPPS